MFFRCYMSTPNVIPWSKEYRLTWHDFMAEPNPAEFEDASSFIKFRFTWTVTSESFGNEIKFAIKNIVLSPEFHRHLSWVRIPMATEQLLNHQQGHFDLAELMRVEITKSVSSIFENKWYPTRGQNEEQRKQFAREDSSVMIAKEMELWEKRLSKKQEEYDKQTDYGQILEKQSEYDATFAQLR